MAQRQLERFQDKIKNAEITRIQALSELEQAKKRAKDLTDGLSAWKLENMRKTEERGNVASSGSDGLGGLLENITEEEKSLKAQMHLLFLELEDLKREKVKLKLKETESEVHISDLEAKLQSLKLQLDDITVNEPKAQTSCNNLMSTIQLLTLESQTARKKSEAVRKILDELTKEAEAMQFSFFPDKSKCEDGLDFGTHQTMFTEMQVNGSSTRVEAIRANEKQGIERLNALKREMEDMKLEREDALKRVGMAEAARRAAEGEMKKLRKEHLRRDDELLKAPSPPRTRVRRPDSTDCRNNFNKCGKISMNQTALLLKVNGLFHKRNTQLESGSHSYLPGER